MAAGTGAGYGKIDKDKIDKCADRILTGFLKPDRMRFFFGHSSENEKIVPEALTDATEGSNLHITRQVSRGQNSKYQVIFDQESHNVLISAKWIILRKTNRRMYGGKRKQKGRNRL